MTITGKPMPLKEVLRLTGPKRKGHVTPHKANVRKHRGQPEGRRSKAGHGPEPFLWFALEGMGRQRVGKFEQAWGC